MNPIYLLFSVIVFMYFFFGYTIYKLRNRINSLETQSKLHIVGIDNIRDDLKTIMNLVNARAIADGKKLDELDRLKGKKILEALLPGETITLDKDFGKLNVDRQRSIEALDKRIKELEARTTRLKEKSNEEELVMETISEEDKEEMMRSHFDNIGDKLTKPGRKTRKY